MQTFTRPERAGLAAQVILTSTLAAISSGCGRRPAPAPPFDVTEKSITDLSKAMASGSVTSRRLVDLYLNRIERYDRHGPSLHALIVLNPKARDEADALDRERQTRGSRGPLHGIPIVLKDNYDTADLPTTTGSIALAGSRPRDDAFQVRKLREAGVVVLGKTNMDELAWGITSISSLGGQTRNPYDVTRNPGGSSGGTAASVAASLATFGMGTDTCGSIRYPAAHNSLVGLRQTLGLSSRNGIVPASHTQDVAGPIARTVEDLAIVLDATVGPDPADPITAVAVGKIAGSFVSHLQTNGLRDARVGVLEPLVGNQPEDQSVARVFRAAIHDLEKAGAASVPIEIPDFNRFVQGASVPQREFKFDLNDYLERTPAAGVRNLAEILDRGLYHAAFERILKNANQVPGRDTQEYREALAKRDVIRETIVKRMDAQRLEVFAYPTLRRTAARIGDQQRGGNCTLSAVTGLPAISVPAGFTEDDDMPVGLELLGRAFSDAVLVKLAYAFEQATHYRRPPPSTPSLLHPRAPARFDVRATGAEEVPAVSSPAIVVAGFEYDAPTRRLDYAVSISGLKPNHVLFTHIHRGEKQQAGPVIETLGGAGETILSGGATLSPSEAADLLGGRLYLDTHTLEHVAGEARGQLMPRERAAGQRH